MSGAFLLEKLTGVLLVVLVGIGRAMQAPQPFEKIYHRRPFGRGEGLTDFRQRLDFLLREKRGQLLRECLAPFECVKRFSAVRVVAVFGAKILECVRALRDRSACS